MQSAYPPIAQRRESLEGDRYSLAEVVIVGNRMSVDHGRDSIFKGTDRYDEGEHKT